MFIKKRFVENSIYIKIKAGKYKSILYIFLNVFFLFVYINVKSNRKAGVKDEPIVPILLQNIALSDENEKPIKKSVKAHNDKEKTNKLKRMFSNFLGFL